MSAEVHRPGETRDVRTYRQGKVDNGRKEGYPGRNEEECTEEKHDLGCEWVGRMEGGRIGERNWEHSEEACLAMGVRANVDSGMGLWREGRGRSGTMVMYGLEDQVMQDWNVCSTTSGAGLI